MLQHTATHCNTLQHISVHSSPVYIFPILIYRIVCEYAAVYCSVLQCVAVCCSVLQCAAEFCSVLHCFYPALNLLLYAIHLSCIAAPLILNIHIRVYAFIYSNFDIYTCVSVCCSVL